MSAAEPRKNSTDAPPPSAEPPALLDYQDHADQDAIAPRIVVGEGALNKHAYHGEFIISNDNIPGVFGEISRFELECRFGYLKIHAYRPDDDVAMYSLSLGDTGINIHKYFKPGVPMSSVRVGPHHDLWITIPPTDPCRYDCNHSYYLSNCFFCSEPVVDLVESLGIQKQSETVQCRCGAFLQREN